MDLLERQKKTVYKEAQPSSSAEGKISIQNLPDETLSYIFSYMNFVERGRIETVCKRWSHVARNPTILKIDGNLVKNRKLSDKAVCSILSRYGSTLNDFILNVCADLTWESLAKIGQYCPNLVVVELHLVGIPQIACLQQIALSYPNIKIMKLELLPKLITSQYKAYNEACSNGLFTVAHHCKNLESLFISTLPNTPLDWLEVINSNMHTLGFHDTKMTSDAMRRLITRLNALEEFSVDNCAVIDQGLVMEFLKHFRHSLKVLQVNNPDAIEGEWHKGITLLVNLEVLKVSIYYLVDDKLMEILSHKCMKLRVLDIGYSRVSDVGLAALQKLPMLRELTIGISKNIRGYGLQSLVSKGVLQWVTIEAANCHLQEVCRNMEAMYPKVRFIMGKEDACVELNEDAEWDEEEENENLCGDWDDWEYWGDWDETNEGNDIC